MAGSVWDALVLVCAVVGGLTLWTLAAGALASVVLKHVHHRRTQRQADPQSGQPPGPGDIAPADAREATVHALLNRRARSWAEMPSWVREDREWASAVVLLGWEGIATRTEPFVDFPSRRVDWAGLREEAGSWSPDDRLLVDVAYELARGRHTPGVAVSAQPSSAEADLPSRSASPRAASR